MSLENVKVLLELEEDSRVDIIYDQVEKRLLTRLIRASEQIAEKAEADLS